MNTLNQYPANSNPCAQFSWSAIFSGLFTSTAIGALAALLGSAIGISLFKPDADAVSMLSIGAVIWFIVTGSIAMFIGGWVTGYFAPYISCVKSTLHGLVLWSIAFLVGLLLSATSAGVILTGSAQLTGKVLSISQETVSTMTKPVADIVSNAVDKDAMKKISTQVKALLKQSDTSNKKNKMDKIIQSSENKPGKLMDKIQEYFSSYDQNNPQLHADMVTYLTENTSLNQQQADKLLTNWEENYQQAVQKAKDKTQELTDNVKQASEDGAQVIGAVTFSAVIAMLIGLLATIWGSCIGAKYRKNHLD